MARNVETGEIKYFISNVAASVPLSDLLTAAFARWQIELWFERAKQEAGLGAFEVRTYRSLLRHWFCSRLAMYFLAAQTQRLRGKNQEITLEQVAEATNALAWTIWNRTWRSPDEIAERCAYYQTRNRASYESRKRKAKLQTQNTADR